MNSRIFTRILVVVVDILYKIIMILLKISLYYNIIIVHIRHSEINRHGNV